MAISAENPRNPPSSPRASTFELMPIETAKSTAWCRTARLPHSAMPNATAASASSPGAIATTRAATARATTDQGRARAPMSTTAPTAIPTSTPSTPGLPVGAAGLSAATIPAPMATRRIGMSRRPGRGAAGVGRGWDASAAAWPGAGVVDMVTPPGCRPPIPPVLPARPSLRRPSRARAVDATYRRAVVGRPDTRPRGLPARSWADGTCGASSRSENWRICHQFSDQDESRREPIRDLLSRRSCSRAGEGRRGPDWRRRPASTGRRPSPIPSRA